MANAEENRQVDLKALRAQGIPVWVTDIRTVNQALASIGRLLIAVGDSDTGWLGQARSSWAQPTAVVEGQRLRAVVTIWRRPWMYLGCATYAGDVLRRLGVDNVLGDDLRVTRSARLSRYPMRIWWCCPMSRTCSPTPMVRRRFQVRPVRWSVVAS